MNFKTMKRSTKSNFITFGIVLGFYLLIQILSAAGLLTNSFSGQLVPICAYVVMAVSLNLTVGILGELSLGHAGFIACFGTVFTGIGIDKGGFAHIGNTGHHSPDRTILDTAFAVSLNLFPAGFLYFLADGLDPSSIF